jgi:hypothetical protein
MIQQTAGLAKPIDYLDNLVDHSTYFHAVIHMQRNAKDSVGVGR